MTRVAVLISVLLTLPLFAFESRLVDSSGRAVVDAQVSVVGQTGSVRTNSEGRFTILPDPKLPATLIVIGSRGEIFPPIHLESLPTEVRLDAAFRESVTVASGAAPNIEDTPAAAPVVVGAEEIEQRKPAHIAEAIATIPGVALRGEGPPAVPVVRGLAGGRTLLIVDDARVVTERRAGPSATFVDPFILGSIEISRGPGSVAYGSDALGGIVHMRPRDPVPGQTEYRYDAWAAFGGRSERSVAAEITTDLLGGAILASIHARAAGDAEDGNGEEIENSQYRDRGAVLRFVRHSTRGLARAGVMHAVAKDVGAPASDTILTTYPEESATLFTFATDVQTKGFFSAAAFRASLGSYSIVTNRIRPTGIEVADVKARDASIRLSGERHTERARLLTGADIVTRFDLRAIGSIDDADRLDTAAFASYEWRATPSFQLAAGGRVDRITSRNIGGHFGDRERNDTALSGHLAATAGPFRAITATVQFASGYREPSLSDRYFRGVSGRGFVVGNPDLEPERSLQFDAVARWSGTRSTLAVFAYDYRIRNLVERFRAGADFNFRNRGEAEIRGFELDWTSSLPRNFAVQLGAAIARGKDADTGDALDDIGAPALHAQLRWAAETKSAFVTASMYGSDDDPGPVETARDGYVTLDTGIGWRFSPALELRLVVRNLTNAYHHGSADEVSSLAPGRSVMIGINR